MKKLLTVAIALIAALPINRVVAQDFLPMAFFTVNEVTPMADGIFHLTLDASKSYDQDPQDSVKKFMWRISSSRMDVIDIVTFDPTLNREIKLKNGYYTFKLIVFDRHGTPSIPVTRKVRFVYSIGRYGKLKDYIVRIGEIGVQVRGIERLFQ